MQDCGCGSGISAIRKPFQRTAELYSTGGPVLAALLLHAPEPALRVDKRVLGCCWRWHTSATHHNHAWLVCACVPASAALFPVTLSGLPSTGAAELVYAAPFRSCVQTTWFNDGPGYVADPLHNTHAHTRTASRCAGCAARTSGRNLATNNPGTVPIAGTALCRAGG